MAALIAAPALLVSLTLSGLEAWRVVRPASPLFTIPFEYSLADAIATGDFPRAFQYIRAGQDPNARIAVRHPDLTKNRWMLALPIEWAAATGQADVIRMLLGYGARPTASASCAAETRGHQDAARVLRTYGGEAAACGGPQMYPFVR